ncbi:MULTISPECIES: Ig-like domain-containing protein [Planococcus]|uniref:Bacterial Ig domain-containing protein n=2 Tax=Planococcus TaxID=1372 RepID=A0ABN4JWU5_9BACL|nr:MULTISPECIES: Ig-like domain-containing protein [Planococcus]ALS79332.1 hypothetical protein AUO94_12055 [Planococcus kocurii]MDJ0332389.1 Ig-like domain-containing protein [Planococcus sp. S3-L1]
MSKKTGVLLFLSGLLALTVSTETTFANTQYSQAVKQLSTFQKKLPVEQKLLKSSTIQQLESQLQKELLIQKHSVPQANTSTVNRAASDYLIEQEPNDDFDFANQLSYSKPTVGQLLPDYDLDFYKVIVPSDGMLAVGGGTTSYEIDLLFMATEKDFKDTGKLSYLASDYDGNVEIQVYQAKAGTYYIPVIDADDYSNGSSDLYIMATSFIDNVAPSKPTVNAIDNNDLVITGKAEANSTVTIKNGSKVIATTKATTKGVFSSKIAAQKAGVKLNITAEDSAKNKSSNATVTVADKTAPAKPIINKITSKDLKITGKVEANATVTAKVGKTVLGSVKADAKGNYSVKIKAQKTGTTIEVTAKDKAGNISNKTTKVVVKK